MNTNNKEALSLVRNFGFNHLFIGLSHDPELCPECIKPHSLDNVVLQDDNKDTEVQDIAVKENTCHRCLSDKPSSKVEKLKELQRRFSTNLDYGAQWADLVKILNVLIEDEE